MQKKQYDIQYRPCIDVVVVILIWRSNYYFEHLKFFFLQSNDYFEYLKLYFRKTVLFRILNYLIIIDLWQQVVLVLELVSVYSPFTTRFKDYILRPSGPNTALKLHLAQRPGLTSPLFPHDSCSRQRFWKLTDMFLQNGSQKSTLGEDDIEVER